MASRKDLKPGDLVVGQSTVGIQQDVGVLTRFGLVIGVDYAKTSYHGGCEDRIRVMWSNPIRFDTVCDCGLVTVDALLRPLEEKCVEGEKSVKQSATSG